MPIAKFVLEIIIGLFGVAWSSYLSGAHRLLYLAWQYGPVDDGRSRNIRSQRMDEYYLQCLDFVIMTTCHLMHTFW